MRDHHFAEQENAEADEDPDEKAGNQDMKAAHAAGLESQKFVVPVQIPQRVKRGHQDRDGHHLHEDGRQGIEIVGDDDAQREPAF